MPNKIKGFCRRPRGLFLIVGPSGSGKTTVLASMVNYLNTSLDQRIGTIEQPIEFVHEPRRSVVVQQEVGVHVASRVDGLRSLRRDNADVVMIDDLDDDAVVREAVAAARTDCLLLAGLALRGAATAVARLCHAWDGGDSEFGRTVVSETGVAVLYRELCARKGGGLVAASKFLVITPAVSKLIRENEFGQIDAAIRNGAKFGMQILDDHLFRLVREGYVSAEDAVERARDPAAMQHTFDADTAGGLDGDS